MVKKLAIGAMVGLGMLFGGGCQCYVDDELALKRFKEQAGTENVQIVRENRPATNFGMDEDVTYELLVDGKPMQGRCTNTSTSPQVCRLYGAGGAQ